MYSFNSICRSAVLLAAVLSFLLTAAQADGFAKEKTMRIATEASSSCDFNQVKVGSFTRSPCSPVFDNLMEEGIRIAMPARVTLSEDKGDPDNDRLPLCITLQANGLFLEKFENVFMAVNLVLVEEDGQTLFTGHIWTDRFFKPRSPSEIPAAELRISIFQKYYNVNLLDFVQLPGKPMHLHAFVVLENLKSNTCTVEVVPE